MSGAKCRYWARRLRGFWRMIPIPRSRRSIGSPASCY